MEGGVVHGGRQVSALRKGHDSMICLCHVHHLPKPTLKHQSHRQGLYDIRHYRLCFRMLMSIGKMCVAGHKTTVFDKLAIR